MERIARQTDAAVKTLAELSELVEISTAKVVNVYESPSGLRCHSTLKHPSIIVEDNLVTSADRVEAFALIDYPLREGI